MTRLVALVGLVMVASGCNQDPIRVKPTPASDYNHTKLLAAVDAFIVAKRTPEAYAAFSKTVTELRPGMDALVAADAERRIVVLALPPVLAMQAEPIATQIDRLALNVWPALLSPKIEADQLNAVRDPRAGEIPPKPGEDVSAYMLRLCVGPLVTDCKHVVPEYQGIIIDALAKRRATERVRNAIADCLECSSATGDPGWRDAVSGWEALDRAAADGISDVENRADPDNWPVAGGASDDDPQLPEAELMPRGDIVVNGHNYGPNQQRIDVLKELRGTGDAIALHFHPDATLAQVRAVLVDARRAGCRHVAVIARESVYPYRRRGYYVADGSGLRANLRPTDSLQLLLHAIDEVAGPGTVARVD